MYNYYMRQIPNVITEYCNNISPSVKRLIRLCNGDLYNGPLYYDKDGNSVLWCDEGAKPFNFVRACNIISNYLDKKLEEQYVDMDCDCFVSRDEAEENYGDYVLYELKDLKKEILGRELVNYV